MVSILNITIYLQIFEDFFKNTLRLPFSKALVNYISFTVFFNSGLLPPSFNCTRTIGFLHYSTRPKLFQKILQTLVNLKYSLLEMDSTFYKIHYFQLIKVILSDGKVLNSECAIDLLQISIIGRKRNFG